MSNKIKITKVADGFDIDAGGGNISLNKNPLATFPIGSLYLSTNEVSPASLFGGSWERVAQGRALFGAGSLNDVDYVANTTKDAGLPEIKGNVSSIWGCTTFDNSPKASGATWLGSQVTNGSASGAGWQMYLHNLGFNASRSNSIYGKSTTVQPNSYIVYMWRRIA